MLDDRTAARRELDTVKQFIWDNPLNAFGWRAYLGAEPGAPNVPAYAVPARREDLSGLAPAWIGVGSIDLFRDEDVAYAERLTAAGVAARLVETPGGPHAFNRIAPEAPMSKAFDADALAWLSAVFTT
jgi:acetyl esterase/lipase